MYLSHQPLQPHDVSSVYTSQCGYFPNIGATTQFTPSNPKLSNSFLTENFSRVSVKSFLNDYTGSNFNQTQCRVGGMVFEPPPRQFYEKTLMKSTPQYYQPEIEVNPDIHFLNSASVHSRSPSRTPTMGQSRSTPRTVGAGAADGATRKGLVVHVVAEPVQQDRNLVPSQSPKHERFNKSALYKTELCTNWMLTGSCSYGNKCHFAHGVEDLKQRMRVENYKTQPCCDPAREGCRRCMYGRRCNYCHPGEPIRRPHPTPYQDKDYYAAVKNDFGCSLEYPFGIYV